MSVAGAVLGHLACFPTRVDWELARAAQGLPVGLEEGEGGRYPQPRVSSRERGAEGAGGGIAPRPVETLAASARGAGWRVKIGYAVGCLPHGRTGVPLAERESWSVRFARDAWCGYAVYRGGAWDSIWVAGASLPPFGMLGRNELNVWLGSCDGLGADWYESIRQRRAEAAEKAKQAAASRPRKARAEGA